MFGSDLVQLEGHSLECFFLNGYENFHWKARESKSKLYKVALDHFYSYEFRLTDFSVSVREIRRGRPCHVKVVRLQQEAGSRVVRSSNLI